MKKPSVNICLDFRRMREQIYSGKYPVYFDGAQKYFATGILVGGRRRVISKSKQSGLSGKVKDEYQRNFGTKYSD